MQGIISEKLWNASEGLEKFWDISTMCALRGSILYKIVKAITKYLYNAIFTMTRGKNSTYKVLCAWTAVELSSTVPSVEYFWLEEKLSFSLLTEIPNEPYSILWESQSMNRKPSICRRNVQQSQNPIVNKFSNTEQHVWSH